MTTEEKIDLIVRYLATRAHREWDEQADAELLALRELGSSVYDKEKRHRSFTDAAMEADRAVLRKLFIDD